MRSKLGLRLLLSLATVAAMGCSLPLGEQPPETDPLEVGLAGKTECLSRVVPVLERFFQAEAKSPEIIAAFDCMNTALTTFEKSTQGRYEDRFTARELAHFIEQYFLEKGSRVPETLLTEIFRIKQLFVGGSLESLTRAEMVNLHSVLEELKRLSLMLNPHMKVYVLDWKLRDLGGWDNDVRIFEDANLAIQQATKDLAILIEKNGLPYHLPNVLILLRELADFNGSQWEWITQVEKAMPLVEKLKKTLAGGEASDIAPTEWKRFALLGARGYVQYLRYYYFIKSADLSVGGNQLVYFVRSVDDLFSYLGDMVGSKPGDQTLTRAELLDILQSLSDFVPRIKISDALLYEVMKVKVVFFGGRLDVFRQEDFERARAKLESFRLLTEKFLNYSSVYSLNWKPENMTVSNAQSYFKMSEANLVEFSERLGDTMENSYDIQDLIKLAAEIDKLYVKEEGRPFKEVAEQYVPVVIVLKNILFSDSSSVIGKSAKPQAEWSLFLNTAGSLYSRYMYYTYFLEKQELLQEPGLTFFNRLTLDSTYFVDSLIKRKENQRIEFSELHELWKVLLQADFVNQKVKVKTLDDLTRVLVQRVLLPPEQRLTNKAIPEGLSLIATETLRSEFSKFIDNQKFLSLVYQGIPADDGKSGQALLADLNAAAPTIPLLEMKMIYGGPLALSFDSMGRLQMSNPPLGYRESTSQTINLVRAAVRVVIRSYAMSLTRIRTYQGISLPEANTLFADLKPLFVDLNMLNPGNKGFADSRFRDANLFTAVGNGDSFADFKELSNLFLMILSGMKVDDLFQEELEKSCQIDKPGTSKEDWNVKLDCVISVYSREMPKQFTSVPDYLKYTMALEPARWQKMFTGLVKAAGAAPDSNGMIKVGDLSLYPHVVQYVETIFQVYDLDRNGELNTREALLAFPTYRKILKDASGLKDEQQLKGLFTWLLKNGKAPEGAEKLQFLFWVAKGENGWKVNASREMLAKILGFIADQMSHNSGRISLAMDLRLWAAPDPVEVITE